MRASAVIFVGLIGAAGVATVASCRAPTQVELKLVSDVPCQQLNGVVINVGSDAFKLEDAFRTTPAGGYFDAEVDLKRCQADGSLGTIFLAPGSDRGVVLVRAGVGARRAMDCAPPRYEGCIVARRRFSYVDNTTLKLTVQLNQDCLNVPCGIFSTCVSGKQCVESLASSCDSNNDCKPDPTARKPVDDPDGGLGTDGGSDASSDGGFTPADASASDAQSVDGAPSDAGDPDGGPVVLDAGTDGALGDAGKDGGLADAGGDAGTDGGSTPGMVRCGFSGVDPSHTTHFASTKPCTNQRCCGGISPFTTGACSNTACPTSDTARTYDFKCDEAADCGPAEKCVLGIVAAPGGDNYYSRCAPNGPVANNEIEICPVGAAFCAQNAAPCTPLIVPPLGKAFFSTCGAFVGP
jgi:hypothetical protein